MLAVQPQASLPAKPEELARFILLAPEKIKAMQAEIRAIQKARLAKEVYDQKQAELDRVRELMLLAYQRMGEITKEMPTAQGARGDLELLPSSGKKFEKTKAQTIQDLGFSTSQVGRMEQMAAHPEIVEEVIAESQAGQTEATQGEVLRRIRERESGIVDLGGYIERQARTEMEQIDRDLINLRRFRKAVNYTALYEITDAILDSVVRSDQDLGRTLEELDKAARMLTIIAGKLRTRRANNGKKNFHP